MAALAAAARFRHHCVVDIHHQSLMLLSISSCTLHLQLHTCGAIEMGSGLRLGALGANTNLCEYFTLHTEYFTYHTTSSGSAHLMIVELHTLPLA